MGRTTPASAKVALALANGPFAGTEGIVDIDTTVEADAPREQIVVDRERAARLGVPQSAIADAIAMAVSGLDATYVHDGASKYPRPVRLRLPAQDQAALPSLLALKVRGAQGQLVPLSELVHVVKTRWDGAIYHKDGLPVVYVTADEAGRLDSPLYGMFSVVGKLDKERWRARPWRRPSSRSRPTPATTPSNGTASGRSRMKPSATWASPTRPAWC
ncbi:efflux RND transporter permease subunit [Thermomonas sp. S9]|uniref:efflux RND transporter permease subunit n=1 Tax=Thermomonas sp. S9 TaxID=2885203 RepID=UPI00216AB761|nr:efflux RND transporter permease subunit [Thermomonas sp. S9]